jgi:hypothetical protein
MSKDLRLSGYDGWLESGHFVPRHANSLDVISDGRTNANKAESQYLRYGAGAHSLTT